MRNLKPGVCIGGYELIKKVGCGVFGEVWQVKKKDAVAASSLAMKILKEVGTDKNQFIMEADRWIRCCVHKNILGVIEANEDEGYWYIISEYLPDGTLRNAVDRNPGKKLEFSEAVRLVIEILEGVKHLHENHVIHRDLKPSNVLMKSNVPVISDFGLARFTWETKHSASIGGSPGYMSPEAFLGQKTHMDDLWSVAIIFYELIVGKRPFDQGSHSKLVQKISEFSQVALSRDVPREISGFIQQAFELDVSRRYQSAGEMIQVLKLVTAITSGSPNSLRFLGGNDKTLVDQNNPIPFIGGNRVEKEKAGESLITRILGWLFQKTPNSYIVQKVVLDDLPELYVSYRALFGASGLVGQDEFSTWIIGCPNASWKIKEVTGNEKGKVVGFFDIYPLNSRGKKYVEKGAKTRSLTLKDIALTERHPDAFYISSVGAIVDNWNIKAIVLANMKETIETYCRHRDITLYARPVTPDGLRLLRHYGFQRKFNDSTDENCFWYLKLGRGQSLKGIPRHL